MEVMKKTRKKRKRPNGRPLLYPDKTIVRMTKGSLNKVNRALRPNEYQGDFMRTAVDKELKYREKRSLAVLAKQTANGIKHAAQG